MRARFIYTATLRLFCARKSPWVTVTGSCAHNHRKGGKPKHCSRRHFRVADELFDSFDEYVVFFVLCCEFSKKMANLLGAAGDQRRRAMAGFVMYRRMIPRRTMWVHPLQ